MREFGLFLLGLGKTTCPYMYLPTYPTYGKLKKFALETANAWGLSSSILFSTTFLEPQLPLAYRCGLRFRNSFVFTTRPPRDAAPSCRSCPSRPQGRRHMCQCARSAGSRWVPQSKRSLHCSARSHCGAAPRRRSMSGLQGQRFSAARGLRQGPGRPHGAPEAAGVASLMTCATRRRGQLRFHNAPHFWHPPASRA